MSSSAVPGQFSPLNRSEWLQKIEKDLRGKSLDDLNIHFGDHLSISPIQHLEDLPENEEIHLSYSRERHKIPGVWLSTEDLDEIDNSLLLKMLNLGAGSLFLDGLPLADDNYAQLLDTVDTDMVDITVGGGLAASTSGLTKTEILKVNVDDYATFKADLVRALSIKTLEQRPPMTFVLNFHDNFYLNLCGLRAIHVIMDQLSRDLGGFNYKTWICAVVKKEEDLASGLLRSMSHYLAGFLGGADHVATQGLKDQEAIRLHLNNAHLICLESKLPEDEDLIAGSFFLDKLTWAIAEDIWDSLQRRFES